MPGSSSNCCLARAARLCTDPVPELKSSPGKPELTAAAALATMEAGLSKPRALLGDVNPAATGEDKLPRDGESGEECVNVFLALWRKKKPKKMNQIGLRCKLKSKLLKQNFSNKNFLFKMLWFFYLASVSAL